MADKILNENFDKEVEELNRVLSAFNEKLAQNENADLSVVERDKINDDPRLIVERDKFKTEAGKQLYDLLVKISDDNSFLYDILYQVRGDEKKNQLIKYLEEDKRTEDDVRFVAERIELDIWGLSSEEAYDKYTSTDISARLFHCLRDIDLIICKDDESKVDYIRILRIMSMLDTDEEREILIDTIIREIEREEIPFKEFMNLIYLKVQNYYDQKHDK